MIGAVIEKKEGTGTSYQLVRGVKELIDSKLAVISGLNKEVVGGPVL